MDPVYRREAFYGERALMGGKFVLIQPCGEKGSGYGKSDGTVRAEQAQGKLRWVNHPHRRSDGAMLPNAQRVIVTEDGAAVLYSKGLPAKRAR